MSALYNQAEAKRTQTAQQQEDATPIHSLRYRHICAAANPPLLLPPAPPPAPAPLSETAADADAAAVASITDVGRSHGDGGAMSDSMSVSPVSVFVDAMMISRGAAPAREFCHNVSRPGRQARASGGAGGWRRQGDSRLKLRAESASRPARAPVRDCAATKRSAEHSANVTPPRYSTRTTAGRPRVAASNAAWSAGPCGRRGAGRVGGEALVGSRTLGSGEQREAWRRLGRARASMAVPFSSVAWDTSNCGPGMSWCVQCGDVEGRRERGGLSHKPRWEARRRGLGGGGESVRAGASGGGALAAHGAP